jgi:hypothetical protein
MVLLFGLTNLHHRQKEGDTSASVASLRAAKSPVENTKPDGEGEEGLRNHQFYIAMNNVDPGQFIRSRRILLHITSPFIIIQPFEIPTITQEPNRGSRCRSHSTRDP